MPRPTEIAADARALYGPLEQRPSAQQAGDGALWVDPESGPALYLVRSGNWGRVGLALRGAHEAATRYGPGDLVTAGGGLYVNTRAIVPDTRADTFDRPDDPDGWGTASDGHVWQQIASDNDGDGVPRLLSGRGQLGPPFASDDGSLMLLGAALSSSDVEMHARFVVHSVSESPGGERPALVLGSLGARALGGTYAWLWSDGDDNTPDNIDLLVIGADAGSPALYTARLTTPRVSDSIYQVRFRHVGLRYQLRVWADLDAEPVTWDLDVTVTDDALGRQVGVHQQANDDTEYVAFLRFSATTLAPAPADDTQHWQEVVSDQLVAAAIQTTAPPSGAAEALPATPAGYAAVTIAGEPKLIAIYDPVVP